MVFSLAVKGISSTRVILDFHSKSPELVTNIFDLSKMTVPEEKKALQNKYQFEEGKIVYILCRREQIFYKVLSSAVSQPRRKKVLPRAT